MALDDALRALARSQRGCFTTQQAIDAGATRSALHHRVERGSLVRIAPRVFVLGGMPIDETTRAVAAVLDAGGRAALSHSSAAAYWGLPGFRIDPLQVTRRRDGTFRSEAFATVHTSRVLLDTHLVLSDGILVTTPARTLFDLAANVHPERLERLVDRCWSEGLVTVPLLERTLRELARRGRPGIGRMRELIATRRGVQRPPESGLEARFQQLLAEDGQAPMERQVDVGGRAWIGRVDFLDRTARLVVEIDGDRFHGSLSDRRDDERRTRELEAAGWQVLRFSSYDIWHRPTEVQRRVRRARHAPMRVLAGEARSSARA